MLILPLHRPLTRRNFPWLTALLVLINLLVFFGPQARDATARESVQRYAQDSGLAKLEADAYTRYRLRTEGAFDQAEDDLPEPMREWARQVAMQSDRRFQQELEQGQWFASPQEWRHWQALDAQRDVLLAEVVTERHALPSSDAHATQYLSAMFLHGGLDHLLGNMLFLMALGLLVETPLGAVRFLLVYLLGGIGAGLAWQAETSDQLSSLIGASGAIAALMGAFCVVWAWRRVRFFYWFFVIFDYVRAPALWLLPIWLGWELLQMGLSASQVAYSAHAGGLVSGALLAFAIRQTGGIQTAWLDDANDEAQPAQRADAEFKRGQLALGQLQLEAAEVHLAAAQALAPERFDVALARLRCAQNARRADWVDERARRVLELPVSAVDDLRAKAKVLSELDASALSHVSDKALESLILQLLARADVDTALDLLPRLQTHRGLQAQMPMLLLRIALRLRESDAHAASRRVLQNLRDQYPDSPPAQKARFLLEQG